MRRYEKNKCSRNVAAVPEVPEGPAFPSHQREVALTQTSPARCVFGRRARSCAGRSRCAHGTVSPKRVCTPKTWGGGTGCKGGQGPPAHGSRRAPRGDAVKCVVTCYRAWGCPSPAARRNNRGDPSASLDSQSDCRPPRAHLPRQVAPASGPGRPCRREMMPRAGPSAGPAQQERAQGPYVAARAAAPRA